MSEISFDVNFGSRNDATPTHDGYTYHHVLPWRYYYLAGYILGSVARLHVLRDTTLTGKYIEQAVKVLRSKNLPLDKEYGKGYEAFDNDLSMSVKDLLDMCFRMHGVGVQNVNSIEAILRGEEFDLTAIGDRCSAPSFGGFLGMAPGHRKDDPKSNPEMIRPFGSSEAWFGALALLQKALEAIAPGITAAKAKSQIKANLTHEKFDKLIQQLRTLIRDHNNFYPFQASDWYIDYNGPKDWVYINGVPNNMYTAPVTKTNTPAMLNNKTAMSVGEVFCLRVAHTQKGESVAFADRNGEAIARAIKVFSNPNDRKMIYWLPTGT